MKTLITTIAGCAMLALVACSTSQSGPVSAGVVGDDQACCGSCPTACSTEKPAECAPCPTSTADTSLGAFGVTKSPRDERTGCCKK